MIVRVTVIGGDRRVDVALPGAVPIAELLPELARGAGMLTPDAVLEGYALLGPAGDRLSDDQGLRAQGIEDGAVLIIAEGAEREPAPVYDDVAEAMAAAVRAEIPPWAAHSTVRAAGLVGTVMALAAAGALLLAGRSSATPPWVLGGVATVIAVTLGCAVPALARAAAIGGAVTDGTAFTGAVTDGAASNRAVTASTASTAPVTDGAAQDGAPGVGAPVVGALAAVYAAVSGLLLLSALDPAYVLNNPNDWTRSQTGQTLLAAGTGAILAGVATVAGVPRRRSRLMAPMVVGTVVAGSGLMVLSTPLPPVGVLALCLAVVVLAGSMVHGAAPDWRLGMANVQSDRLTRPSDITAPARPIDLHRLRGEVLAGHDVMLAVTASVGAVLVLFAPIVVAEGVAGTVLAMLSCLALLLRARARRASAEVLAGLVGASVGLLAVTVTVMVVHSGWRPVASGCLMVSAVVAVGCTMAGSNSSARWSHGLDVLESGVLLALLPVAVVASGLLARAIG